MNQPCSEKSGPVVKLDPFTVILNSVSNDVRRILKVVNIMEEIWRRGIEVEKKYENLQTANAYLIRDICALEEKMCTLQRRSKKKVSKSGSQGIVRDRSGKFRRAK